jgi:hypothetical protein
LHDGAAKVRAGPVIFETGMKHADGLAVQCFELAAQEALLLPNGLKQMFGRSGWMIFPQRIAGDAPGAILGVEIVRAQEHLAIAFAGTGLQSQAKPRIKSPGRRLVAVDD